ncbi:hypothetical protein GRI97_13310 [Altererythrobacter xixiisoli]|uniref:Tetratricopeptide repeat protein n=1 Tax=Croceibacterium xixiisoli TaxID=1476466 RepID=A0A6I4TV57_9SPHN|nr:DUF4919 domain-containing protein [Croceibacterium xixiisoli]MXO99966.1 hypothetical protein [Croceibacterium xixiisoli]
MFRMPLTAGRKSLRGVVSGFALVATLAGGAVIGTAMASAPAAAQSKPKNSKKFVDAYTPVSNAVNAEGGDLNAAKAQLPGVIAAVENETDRFLAGNLALVLGGKLTDKALQRQGLEIMLQSGQVEPDKVAQFQFFVGQLALDAKDYPAALAALKQAKDGGFQEPALDQLIFAAYIENNQANEGLAFLKTTLGAGTSDAVLRAALQAAYDSKDSALANEWSATLVKQSPTEANWKSAIQVVEASNDFDAQATLDLMRLMSATGSLKEEREFRNYIEAADPRIMSNEVLRVIASGQQAGVFAGDDAYVAEVKAIADPRAPEDQREAAGLATAARSSGAARDALIAGNVMMSLAKYAEAEEMFALALEKGAPDRDLAATRLGIAQAHQGKAAEAKATLDQVTGARAPLAQLWAIYAASKS